MVVKRKERKRRIEDRKGEQKKRATETNERRMGKRERRKRIEWKGVR